MDILIKDKAYLSPRMALITLRAVQVICGSLRGTAELENMNEETYDWEL